MAIYSELNCLTGEIVVRDMTDDEIKLVKKAQEQEMILEQERKQKIENRKSALSKLIDLGLTEEEIASL